MSPPTLRARLAAGERLVGTWIKTPSPIAVEVLADTDLDLLVLDAEHAPFGSVELDACTVAARAAGKDVIVRVASSHAHHILQALDSGATGVLVPQVRSGDEAEVVAGSARFGPGGRRYAGSSRAAGYGTKSMADHKADSAAQTVVIAQVEDAEAVAETAAIAATPGIDAVFIGTVDHSVSLGSTGADAPEVIEAVAAIPASARAAECPVGVFANTRVQVERFVELGMTLFLMQSDHSFLCSGAATLGEVR